MNVTSWIGRAPPSTSLARVGSFRLGPLEVDPAIRQVYSATRQETLEPRVMQVLVALASQPGRVFTRTELIERCWDGAVVSDTAINRVLSILRRTLARHAQETVRIETITKVGFRLLVDETRAHDRTQAGEPAVAMPVPSAFWSRRSLLGLGAIAGGALLVGRSSALWRRHVPDPRAVELFRRGDLTMKSGQPGATRQALSYYRQAIAIDPDYADAWGALAIGYRHAGMFVSEPRDSYSRMVHSAARRALALDPDQPDARIAIILIRSDLGRWAEVEAGVRQIVHRFPAYWFGHAQLDLLLQNVGRFNEGVASRQRLLELDSSIPVAWAFYARGLHHAGREQEADIALDHAFAKWPAHPFLWNVRFQHLIGSRRYSDAAAFARDPRSLPEFFPKPLVRRLVDIANALAARDGIDAQISTWREDREIDSDALAFWAPFLAELGAHDDVLAAIEAYFFGGEVNGVEIAAPSPLDQRPSVVLFSPSLAPLRHDPRYLAILDRIGLERYWRSTGTLPDYRRSA